MIQYVRWGPAGRNKAALIPAVMDDPHQEEPADPRVGQVTAYEVFLFNYDRGRKRDSQKQRKGHV